jgi:tetratricopeptide (TPR) repeat protein
VAEPLDDLLSREAALRAHGDFDGALRVLDEILAIDPALSPALNNKGTILTMRHRYADAIPLLQSALAADPANAVAHNNLGSCLHHTGRHEEALEQLEAAWDGGYQHAGVLYNAGRVNVALGRLREGLSLMLQGLEGSPDPAETMAFLQTLARALDVQDDRDVRRFGEALLAATDRIDEIQVVRADPPLGMFYVRIVVDGVSYGIEFE